MFALLFELFGELLLQIAVEMLSEFGLHSLAEPFKREPNPWLAALGYAIFGAALGGLSLMVFPNHFTPAGATRIANLIVTPIIVGLSMSALGAWRSRRGDTVFRIDRFACGFIFAAALALVRFHFAA